MSDKFASGGGSLAELTSSTKTTEAEHYLPEQKQQLLMYELECHIDRTRKLRAEISAAFKEAYAALQNASISLGIEIVDDLAQAVVETDDILVRFHSVMGVEIPDIAPLNDTISPAYSMRSSNASVDDAYLKFRKVLSMLTRIAEIETAVIRLAVAIRSARHGANELEKTANSEQQKLFIADTFQEEEIE